MATVQLSIETDASPLQATLGELLEQAADLPLEIRNGLVRRFESIAQTFRVDLDNSAAAGAGNLRVVLQPSDALLELVGALRAGQFDFLSVEIQAHGGSLVD